MTVLETTSAAALALALAIAAPRPAQEPVSRAQQAPAPVDGLSATEATAPQEPQPVGAGEDAAPPSPAPVPRFALVGATVHTMVPGVEPAPATVLVTGDRVDAVGADLELPLGVERIDCTGLHLVPGLIDGLVTYDPQHDELYTTSGVTTVRDTGGNPSVRAQLKAPGFRDRVPGPFLVSAGGVLDGVPPVSPTAVILRSEEDADRFVGLLVELGMDYACLMPNLDPALIPAVVTRARAAGWPVWGMVPSRATYAQAAAAGVDGFFGLEALLPFDEQSEEPFDRLGWDDVLPIAFRTWAKEFAESGAALVPVLLESARLTERGDTDAPDFDYLDFYYAALWLDDAQARRRLIDDPELGEEYLSRARTRHERRAALLAALERAGVTLVPGTSASNPWMMPGWALHDELAQWVAAGVAPGRALESATRVAADALGLADRGRIASGTVADLVLVAGDPREDLSVLRRPEQVVVRGRRLTRADLDELLARLASTLAEARAENERPLEIEAPRRPEGGAVVLAGRARSSEYGQRYQGERFEVVRLEDGRVAVNSRLLQPARGQFPERTFEFSQVLRDGLLESFEIVVTMVLDGGLDVVGPVEAAAGGEQSMVVRGAWLNGRFNVERTLNGQSLGTRTMTQRPAAVTLDPLHDTITCPLVLGQLARDGEAIGVVFGEMMEPVVWRWLVRTEPDGARIVASEAGAFRVRYDERGVPLRTTYTAGGQVAVLEVDPGSLRDFGGAGLPVRYQVPAPPAGAEGGGRTPGADGGAGDGGGDGDGGADDVGTGG